MASIYGGTDARQQYAYTFGNSSSMIECYSILVGNFVNSEPESHHLEFIFPSGLKLDASGT